MAKGQKIDELYISLGLDIARLQLDFDTAGRTVSQTMARLNSESKQLTLKTDIDLTKLEGAGKELDQLKITYQAINQQLSALSAEYQDIEAKAKAINRPLHDLKHEWITLNPRERFIKPKEENV